MDAAGVIAHYVMDTSTGLSASGDRLLTAETGGNTTFYLYGLGAIGEKTTDWNFSLPDGTNTPRQLTNAQGEITLSSRYTPWGDTLDTFGTGNFSFGYLGGVLDATTGLLYVGNGQYYDPSTGRFLTRNVNPNSANPYVPWNPIGAIIGPLGLVALVFGRRRKGSKVGTFLVLVLALGSVGMTLAGCTSGNVTVTATYTPGAPVNYTATFDNGLTVTGTLPASSGAASVIATSCATIPPTPSPTPTETSTPYTSTILTEEQKRQLHTYPGAITGVSALELYEFYRDYYVANANGWWWQAFASEDHDFSIWDYISAVSYFEASRQHKFAPIMAEAGVRFYHGRCNGYCGTDPVSVLNWWAEFSESAARQQKTKVIEPEAGGIASEMSIIGDSFSLKYPLATEWMEGWNYSRPYNWGNLYSIKNLDARNVFKTNSHALFIKYGTDADWANDKTFVVPSGCLWKKGDAFYHSDQDPNIVAWRNEICPTVQQMR